MTARPIVPLSLPLPLPRARVVVARRVAAVLVLIGALAPLAPLATAAPAQDWPQLALPRQIEPFDIGTASLNGLPLRLRGFVSPAPPLVLAQWFRESLGQPLVESRLGGKLILGRLQGGHYLTVQLEATASGSRGVIGISDLVAARDGQRQHRDDAERWIARWPAGSRLMSQMVSQDGDRVSHHSVVANGHGSAVNAERMKSLLAEDGFSFEREGAPTADDALPPALASSRVLFFKGIGKDAIATIHRDSRGRTSIVLNTVSRIERLR